MLSPVYVRAITCLTPAGFDVVSSPAGPMCSPPLAAPELPPSPGWPPAGWINPVPRIEGTRLPRFGRLDRLAQLGLLVACKVVERAGGATLPEAEAAAGVALGTHYGSHLTNELFWRSQRGPAGPSPALFAYTLPSAAAAEIAMHFGLTGPALTVAGAADSGLAALAAAAGCIASGAASRMLVVAVDVLSPSLLSAREGEEEPLEEGAFCAWLDSRSENALARLVGVAQLSGADARKRCLAVALEQAGLRRADLRVLLTRRSPGREVDRGWSGYSEPRGLGAAPLLAGAPALRRGELPLLVVAEGASSATALCCAPPS